MALFAIAFTQAPSFLVQYKDHLKGHVQELVYQQNVIKEMTRHSDLLDYAKQLRGHEVQDLRWQGKFIQDLYTRHNTLEASLHQIENASAWNLPFVFIYHLNTKLVQETLDTYTYTFPMNWNGALYLLAGSAFGFALYTMLGSFFCGLWRAMTKKKA